MGQRLFLSNHLSGIEHWFNQRPFLSWDQLHLQCEITIHQVTSSAHGSRTFWGFQHLWWKFRRVYSSLWLVLYMLSLTFTWGKWLVGLWLWWAFVESQCLCLILITEHQFTRLFLLEFRGNCLTLLHLHHALFHRHFCRFAHTVLLGPSQVLLKVVSRLNWKVELNSLSYMTISGSSSRVPNTPLLFEMCCYRVTRDIRPVTGRLDVALAWVEFDWRELAATRL